MTSTSGAKHDVEDILASIRTSIADRSPLGVARGEHRIQALRNSANVADELPDFELPAIFKPAAPASAEKPNLLGRLSEALSTSSEPSADRSRTVIRFEPAHSRANEQSAAAQAAKIAERAAAEKAAAEKAKMDESLKREMPSFFDTRISRMGAMTRAAEEPSPAPSVRQAQLSQPPELPPTNQLFEADGMEDAAAQLLRPILQQWLTDNMPKIVEKALRSEMGGGDKNGGPQRR